MCSKGANVDVLMRDLVRYTRAWHCVAVLCSFLAKVIASLFTGHGDADDAMLVCRSC